MKKAKKERKYTLSGQMTAIFIGLLVFYSDDSFYC